MKLHIPRKSALLSLAAALSGALILAACGGGGGGGTPPPTPTPITGTTPGIVEGTVSGTANGTTTGVVNGTSVGVSSGSITGTSVGIVNGTVTGTVTQVVGTSTSATPLTNTLFISTGTVTVTGAITGTVTGTVNGSVSGTVAGTATGTVTGVVQGSASGTVTPPAVSAASAIDIARGNLQQLDAFNASFKPTGAERFGPLDNCFLDNGNSKAFLISDWDSRTDNQARTAFDIGSIRANTPITIVSDTSSPNADGTQRREIEFTYSVNYTDGSQDNNARRRIISGSSSGSTTANGGACSNPENKAQWRNIGNKRIANTFVRSQNQYSDDLNRTTAADFREQFRREVQLIVTDPANIADYAIVSAPIMQQTAGGSTAPLAYKLLSPRIIRSAPELAGKRGNFTNAGDLDAFEICLFSAASGNFGFANNADCTAGAQGVGLSTSLSVPAGSPSLSLNDPRITQADTNFNTFWNLSAGVTFTFALYKDDGWKTVNGQAGKTPVATYTAVLNSLPFTFLEMNNGGNGHFRYPLATNGQLNGAPGTAVSLLNAVTTGSGTFTQDIRAAITPNLPNNFRLSSASQYFEGSLATNANGAFWPQQRFDFLTYPGGNATAVSYPIQPAPAAISSKTFNQFVVNYTDRSTGNRIRSRLTFQ